MRLRRRTSDPVPTTQPQHHGPERRLRYWVKRDQSVGGNLSGECKAVEVARSGALVLSMSGKRRMLAPGTWSEAETTQVWTQGGDT